MISLRFPIWSTLNALSSTVLLNFGIKNLTGIRIYRGFWVFMMHAWNFKHHNDVQLLLISDRMMLHHSISLIFSNLWLKSLPIWLELCVAFDCLGRIKKFRIDFLLIMGIIIILTKVVPVCGGWVVVSCARFLLVVLVRRRVHAHDNAF